MPYHDFAHEDPEACKILTFMWDFYIRTVLVSGSFRIVMDSQP